MPNPPIDLTTLRASRHHLEAALAGEHRKRVRKRLVAICSLLNGKSISEAAADAEAGATSVERWLARVRQSGLHSLLRDRRRRRTKWTMTAAEVEETRREIAAALARPLKAGLRTRLLATDAVLTGQPVEQAAASAGVLTATVHYWLREVALDGIVPTLARLEGRLRARPREVHADPAALRALAANETDPRVRKRILAIACVAEGMSPHAASFATRVDYGAVRRLVKRFKVDGIAAVQEKPRLARNKKLTTAQIQELGAAILGRPLEGIPELREFIFTRFGVRYSADGLRLLLKRDLAII